MGCTKELKVCPDGSTVARTGLDCVFEECPSEACNYDDPEKPYTFRTVDECAVSLITCVPGYAYFSDSCGYGCKPVEEPACDYEKQEYHGKSPAQCATIRFKCAEGQEYFSDDCGCGCRAASERYACNPAGPAMTLCTMDYKPVCGWFRENISCITYPCAQTFSNDCAACQSADVAYWTAGACPA